jgi:hypothetical protein
MIEDARTYRVAADTLAALARQVPAKAESQAFQPIAFVGTEDYESGYLKFRLDRAPDPRWVECFKNPDRASVSYYSGSSPREHLFEKHLVHVHAPERYATTIRDNFFKLVDLANEQYLRRAESERREREQSAENEHRLRVQQAEAKERVLGALRRA